MIGVSSACRLEALQAAVPSLVSGLESSLEGAHHAAVAITTTDLVSKSAALEVCAAAASRQGDRSPVSKSRIRSSPFEGSRP